ncbi:MAG: hypothetical protein AAFY26_19055 [Cyanobacteria bacterium J06638_22]
MSVKQSQYEALLAEYCDHQGAIALLQQYRSYLEMIPSMRRPTESLITIPLPLIRVRVVSPASELGGIPTRTTDTAMLPCDVGIIMCDPEWKIKTGGEIFVFIHRPQEDFSDLLSRWRHTQMLLHQDYEWVMPHRYKHILNEAADDTYPLFVTFQNTPDRIRKGLRGAGLPYLVQHIDVAEELDMGARQQPSAFQDIEEIFSDSDDGI